MVFVMLKMQLGTLAAAGASLDDNAGLPQLRWLLSATSASVSIGVLSRTVSSVELKRRVMPDGCDQGPDGSAVN
jgi:hypothetical protein